MTDIPGPATVSKGNAVDNKPPRFSVDEEGQITDNVFPPTPISQKPITQMASGSKYDILFQDAKDIHTKYIYKYLHLCHRAFDISEVEDQEQRFCRDYIPEVGRKCTENIVTGKIPAFLTTKDQFDLTQNDRIRRPESLKHLKCIIAYNGRTGNRLTVVWFYRRDLLTCKRVYAHVQKCAEFYKHMIDMLEVEVSNDKTIPKYYHVTTVPSFLFFLDGEECEEERIRDGSHMPDLHEKIKRLYKYSKEAEESRENVYDKNTKAGGEPKNRDQGQSQSQGQRQSQRQYQKQNQKEIKTAEKKQDNGSLEDDDDDPIIYRPQTVTELAQERYGGHPDTWDMEAPFNSVRPSMSQQTSASRKFSRHEESCRYDKGSQRSVSMNHYPPSRKVCDYFVRGKCSYGDSCCYRHLSGEEAEAYRADMPVPMRKRICKYFPIGKCFYGEECWFVHDHNDQ